jgi:hypothetical protein
MSENSEEKKEIKLKGVIPAKRTNPGAFQEALEDLRKFLRKYPFLADEVMKEREKQHTKRSDSDC